MTRMRKYLAPLLSGALLAALLALPAEALAHEQRDVGKYHFSVGFLTEPALQNQVNGLDLTVTTAADKKPVEGAEKTLKAEVIVGGNAKSMPLTLTARFGQPGKYAAYFMPTASGAYTFHLTGTINGDPVDQRFESGPGRFDDVAPLSPLQFPDKLGDPAQVQTRLDEAQAAASQGRLLGILGVVLGAAGLAVGVLGLSRARSAAHPARAASRS